MCHGTIHHELCSDQIEELPYLADLEMSEISTLKYSTGPYSTGPYSTAEYSTVQLSTALAFPV